MVRLRWLASWNDAVTSCVIGLLVSGGWPLHIGLSKVVGVWVSSSSWIRIVSLELAGYLDILSDALC